VRFLRRYSSVIKQTVCVYCKLSYRCTSYRLDLNFLARLCKGALQTHKPAVLRTLYKLTPRISVQNSVQPGAVIERLDSELKWCNTWLWVLPAELADITQRAQAALQMHVCGMPGYHLACVRGTAGSCALACPLMSMRGCALDALQLHQRPSRHCLKRASPRAGTLGASRSVRAAAVSGLHACRAQHKVQFGAMTSLQVAMHLPCRSHDSGTASTLCTCSSCQRTLCVNRQLCTTMHSTPSVLCALALLLVDMDSGPVSR
jgi:hypothetical protein